MTDNTEDTTRNPNPTPTPDEADGADEADEIARNDVETGDIEETPVGYTEDLLRLLDDTRGIAQIAKHLSRLHEASKKASAMGLDHSNCQRLIKMGNYAERLLEDIG